MANFYILRSLYLYFYSEGYSVLGNDSQRDRYITWRWDKIKQDKSICIEFNPAYANSTYILLDISAVMWWLMISVVWLYQIFKWLPDLATKLAKLGVMTMGDSTFLGTPSKKKICRKRFFIAMVAVGSQTPGIYHTTPTAFNLSILIQTDTSPLNIPFGRSHLGFRIARLGLQGLASGLERPLFECG